MDEPNLPPEWAITVTHSKSKKNSTTSDSEKGRVLIYANQMQALLSLQNSRSDFAPEFSGVDDFPFILWLILTQFLAGFRPEGSLSRFCVLQSSSFVLDSVRKGYLQLEPFLRQWATFRSFDGPERTSMAHIRCAALWNRITKYIRGKEIKKQIFYISQLRYIRGNSCATSRIQSKI